MPIKEFNSEQEMEDESDRIEGLNFEYLDMKEKISDLKDSIEDQEGIVEDYKSDLESSKVTLSDLKKELSEKEAEFDVFLENYRDIL